jgi:hypothetical protein
MHPLYGFIWRLYVDMAFIVDSIGFMHIDVLFNIYSYGYIRACIMFSIDSYGYMCVWPILDL